MSLVLCGITAYEFWRSALLSDSPEFGTISKSTYLALNLHVSAARVSAALRRIDGVPGDLHILVSKGNRCHVPGITCHYVEHPELLPEESFYQVSHGLYIVSPQLCFLQVAEESTFLDLARIGTDLCSKYLCSPYEKEKLIQLEQQRFSSGTFRAYLAKAQGFRGIAKARAAARWIVDNTRSPRETSMALLMTLPSRRGGFQLHGWEANALVDLDEQASLILRQSKVECDMLNRKYWRTFEYNSDLFHDTEEAGEHDLEKITALQSMGYVVTPISTRQFNDFDVFESIVLDTRRKMGSSDRSDSHVSRMRRFTHADLLETERANRRKVQIAETARWKYMIPRL